MCLDYGVSTGYFVSGYSQRMLKHLVAGNEGIEEEDIAAVVVMNSLVFNRREFIARA